MKRLSTGVLAVVLTAGMGLSAVAAPSQPGSHGNIGPNVIAQARRASPSPAATARHRPRRATPAASPAPACGNADGVPLLRRHQRQICRRRTSVPRRPDKSRSSSTTTTFTQSRTNSSRAASWLRSSVAEPSSIPLRSMFEQMGATVSYDPGSKTVDVTKPGADVKVTVGKPEVVINGETRPLDVPPEIYQGHVVVPVRVISEGMGAYVQWVPDKPSRRRPLPAADAAADRRLPTEAADGSADAGSDPAFRRPSSATFIAGDYIISPKVYNEFSPGNTGNNTNGGFSYRVHGAWEFNLAGLPWMLEGDYRQYQLSAQPASVTGTPARSASAVPPLSPATRAASPHRRTVPDVRPGVHGA